MGWITGNNTSTKTCEVQDTNRILQELRTLQLSVSTIDRAAKAIIQALDVSLPIGYPTSIPKGQRWLQELFNGHPDRIRNGLGVRKQVFKQFILDLSAQGHRESDLEVPLEEQLGIFLYMCTTGLPCRRVGERTDRSSDTVKKYSCCSEYRYSSFAPRYCCKMLRFFSLSSGIYKIRETATSCGPYTCSHC